MSNRVGVDLRNYALVTAGYWAFTLTDGALRMLVLLHFHDLGYSPVSIAFLFLAYELMGVLTNILGGGVGSRTGLHRTLMAGLALQILTLVLLSLQSDAWSELWSVSYVMGAQALSGVAKDLTKMSSKSAVKVVAGDGALFRLVAVLTGSKNALKGAGFFVGAALLAAIGYDATLLALAAALFVVAFAIVVLLDGDLWLAKRSVPLRSVFSKSDAINRLSAARFFLFGSRDIWFVVALPVFLSDELDWSFQATGAFLAAWVIGYGMVQSSAPLVVGLSTSSDAAGGREVHSARWWALALVAVSAAIAIAVSADAGLTLAVVGGLVVFGVVFAMNSSLHSYLEGDDVALDVGFYYSANAGGRLVGTFRSGVLALVGGLEAALWGSTAFVVVAWLLTLRLPAPRAETPGVASGVS